MPKTHLNPPTLFDSRRYGFSQGVACRGGTTVYVSGQVGWDPDQQIVDAHDLGAQTRRALQNLEAAVQAAGGTRDDVVSLRLYIVGEHIHSSAPVGEALRGFFDRERPPASSWIGVTALARPEFLIEIEAFAVVD
jgi:enamine deaminase RidA (YjgF/YER057c/UK114 family)